MNTERFQQSQHALGSTATLTLIMDNATDAKQLFRSLWKEIDDFEARFSRFKLTSELSRVNSRPGKLQRVSEPFIALLTTSLKWSKQTKGLYNPFILPGLQKVGYIGSWPHPHIANPVLNFSDRSIVDSNELAIRQDHIRLPDNSALDFGGIGKGYLLDQLASVLKRKSVQHYWLSLGGDILCNGFDLEQRPWKIGIADARNPQTIAMTLTNSEGSSIAIATSGTTKRKGPDWHHLIDPRTGQSAATDILTATVCVEQATNADIYAKCLVLLGSDQARPFIIDNTIPYVLLQTNDKQLYYEKGALMQ